MQFVDINKTKLFKFLPVFQVQFLDMNKSKLFKFLPSFQVQFVDIMSPRQKVKEHLWQLHFNDYGRGVCMYRTKRWVCCKCSTLNIEDVGYLFNVVLYSFAKLYLLYFCVKFGSGI